MVLRPKNIVFVSSNTLSNEGGSELLWKKTAIRLAGAGHSVHACIARLSKDVPEIERKLVRGGVSVSRYPELPGFLFPAMFLQMVRRKRPDLIVINQLGIRDGIAWAERCVASRIPFLLISQAVRVKDWPNDQLAKKMLSVYGEALENIFVSESGYQLFCREVGGTLPRVSTIYNEMKLSEDCHIPWPDKSGGLRLACVSRIDPSDKGQDLLLDVLQQTKWKKRKLTVSLIGQGTMQESFARTIERAGLSSRLVMKGFIEDVKTIWADHHGLVLPSREEAMSIALLEAMNCGRLVIATPGADHRKFIQDGVTGFLMGAASASELDAALERAWESRTRWRSMGEKARARLKSLIPVSAHVTLTEKILEHLGESKPLRKAS